MAYTTINKPTLHFNTKLYSGTGSSNAITGVGFQPDWIWIKRRSATNSSHIVDVIRGATKAVASDLTNAEYTSALSSIDSDGFTVTGSPASANDSSSTYASWNWKAGGSSVSNSDGATTSYVSANTTAGFSIVKWTGTGSATTIGHGLSSKPQMIIIKNYSASQSWVVYNENLQGTEGHKALYLNQTDAQTDQTGFFNDTAATSSVFTVGSNGNTNNSGDNFIAYCFHSVKGYSKLGKYQGNGSSSDGSFIYTGFKPAFVMAKVMYASAGADFADWWSIHDSKRLGYNGANRLVHPNTTAAEGGDNMHLFSNGFKPNTSNAGLNSSSGVYMYYAVAEAPIVGTNNVPANAR